MVWEWVKVWLELTRKLVFPIWQSPITHIFKLTKSESLSPAAVDRSSDCNPDSIVSGDGDGGGERRDSRWYRIGFPMEQTIILSQMNLKNFWKIVTLSSILTLILTRTIFRQSWVIFPVASAILRPPMKKRRRRGWGGKWWMVVFLVSHSFEFSLK